MSDLEKELDRFESLATKLLESQPKMNSNTQTLTIDAGNKALWFVACTSSLCCIVMFVLSLSQHETISMMRADLSDATRQLSVAQDKLSIILQWAPNLRDEVNKEMKDKETR